MMKQYTTRAALVCAVLGMTACAESVPSGPDLNIQLFTAQNPRLDPIPAGMPSIRVTARDHITGSVLKSSTFGIGDSGASFSGVPYGDAIQVVVEGLDANGFPFFRGQSTPFAFSSTSGDRRVPIFFTGLETFTEATSLGIGADGEQIVQPVRFAVGATRAGHAQTPLPGGRVLFTGGVTLEAGVGLAMPFVPGDLGLSAVTGAVEVYDPASGSFFALPEMTTPRAFHTTTQLTDGRILVVGGVTIIETDDGPVIETVRPAEIFDPSNQRWTQVAGDNGLATGRAWHTATLRRVDGKVVIIGGRNLTRGAVEGLADAEVFDPNTDRFEPGVVTVPMGQPRAEHTAVLARSGPGLGADIVVIGGEGENGPIEQLEILRAVNNNSLFEFDDAAPRLRTARYAHTSIAVTVDGASKILTLGGIGEDGRAVSALELFDPAENLSAEGGALISGRSHTSAVVLPGTGRVLLIGGLDSRGSVLGTAESLSFRSSIGVFETESIQASMITGRYLHQVTLLNNGLVLLTGGVGDDSAERATTNRIELFNPDDGSPIQSFLEP